VRPLSSPRTAQSGSGRTAPIRYRATLAPHGLPRTRLLRQDGTADHSDSRWRSGRGPCEESKREGSAKGDEHTTPAESVRGGECVSAAARVVWHTCRAEAGARSQRFRVQDLSGFECFARSQRFRVQDLSGFVCFARSQRFRVQDLSGFACNCKISAVSCVCELTAGPRTSHQPIDCTSNLSGFSARQRKTSGFGVSSGKFSGFSAGKRQASSFSTRVWRFRVPLRAGHCLVLFGVLRADARATHHTGTHTGWWSGGHSGRRQNEQMCVHSTHGFGPARLSGFAMGPARLSGFAMGPPYFVAQSRRRPRWAPRRWAPRRSTPRRPPRPVRFHPSCSRTRPTCGRRGRRRD